MANLTLQANLFSVFFVSGSVSEGATRFQLKIFDTKISFNSTSGECITFKQRQKPEFFFAVSNFIELILINEVLLCVAKIA